MHTLSNIAKDGMLSSASFDIELLLHALLHTPGTVPVYQLLVCCRHLSVQNARTRERMGALLSKAKQLQQPAAAAAAAAAPAEGANEDAAAGAAEQQQEQQQQPAMSPAERLAVGEEFLKQLGARPLAAALGDLNRLLDAQAAADSKPEVGGMRGYLFLQLQTVLRDGAKLSLACRHHRNDLRMV
jgi:uncharacterized membrane protein